MNFVSNILVPLISASIGGFISIYLYRKGIEDKRKSDKLEEIEGRYKKEIFFSSRTKREDTFFFYINEIIGKFDFTSKNAELD